MRSAQQFRWIVIGLGLLAVAFGADCHYTRWQRHIRVQGADFNRVRYCVNHQGDTLLIIGRLARETLIGGVPCAASWLHMTAEGQLELFQLACDTTLFNVELPARTWIRRYSPGDRTIVVFPQHRWVQGFLCRGGGGSTGVQTSFDADGQLCHFYAPRDTTIDGIPCAGNVFHSIALYPDGRLKACTAAKTIRLNDVLYRKGRRIIFDQSGRVTDDD